MSAAAVFVDRWFAWHLFLRLASNLGMHMEPNPFGEVLVWTGRDYAGAWVALP